MISPESKIEVLYPTDKVVQTRAYIRNPSARKALSNNTWLKRFPPFLSLQLDIEDRWRMQDPVLRSSELRKSMRDFSDSKYMTMFGRPLWLAYTQPKEMNRVAKLKLVGGKQ